MNTLRELFDLIAEHPFVTLFLVLCIGWVIESITSVIKSRLEMKARREEDLRSIEKYNEEVKQRENTDI